MPGWSSSDRQHQLPRNWASEIVPRIMARDRRRCQWRMRSGRICGRTATDVDHVITSGPDTDDNLQALCGPHHRWKSSHEGGIASGAARRQRKAEQPKPLHPGLLDRAPDRTPPPF